MHYGISWIFYSVFFSSLCYGFSCRQCLESFKRIVCLTYKSISSAFAGLPIGDDDRLFNLSIDSKVLPQALVGGVIGQAPHEQLGPRGILLVAQRPQRGQRQLGLGLSQGRHEHPQRLRPASRQGALWGELRENLGGRFQPLPLALQFRAVTLAALESTTSAFRFRAGYSSTGSYYLVYCWWSLKLSS